MSSCALDGLPAVLSWSASTRSPPPTLPPAAVPAAPPVVPPTAGAAGASGSALSRELTDFLVELQVALQKHAFYPADHPLVDAAADGVAARLTALLAERPVLSLGVARRQLIVDGVATDASNGLLRELSGKLHRNHVGAVKLRQGIARAEVADLLATLGAEPLRDAEALGLRADELNARWTHARLFPLTFGQLELVDDDDEATHGEAGGATGGPGPRGGRAAELWAGLARAAMASGERARAAEEAPSLEPALVAQAIDAHEREVAYDQVVVGYLLQITDAVRDGQAGDTAGLSRRMSRLVRSLSPETLSTLLAMGGDALQRRSFVLDASQAVSVDAIVELLRAAAAAERRPISDSMLRMLTKLARHAETEDPGRRRTAEVSLREHVGRLVGEWSLTDPNPEAYRAVLDRFAQRAGAAEGASADQAGTDCEPERVLRIALEIDADGPPVRRALDALVATGAPGIAGALELAECAPQAALAERIWATLLSHDALRALLARPQVDTALLERVAHHHGPEAVALLLDALEASEDAAWRERIGAVAASLGQEVGPEVVRRAVRAEPGVQCEMLAILGRLPTLPLGFNAEAYLRSADARVRREAARLALREPGLPSVSVWNRLLRLALEDGDAWVVRAGLAAAERLCSPEAIALMLLRVQRGDLDAGLRAAVVRFVASRRDEALVPWLVARVVERTPVLRRQRLRERCPEMLAALEALAADWASDARAKGVLALAAKAPDADVRQAVVPRSARAATSD